MFVHFLLRQSSVVGLSLALLCLVAIGCEQKPEPAENPAPATTSTDAEKPAEGEQAPADSATPATSEGEGAKPGGPNTLSGEELAEGWILLFDGETLFGWEPETDANWKVKDGAITVDAGEAGLLCTTSEFGDFELKVEFKSQAKTNSGIFLRTARSPKDPAVDCYELNIAEEEISPFPTGSFVKRQKASVVNHQNDQWQTFHVSAEGGHFTVMIDGEQVLDYTDPNPIPVGPIGLQLNSGPVAFRNIKLKPLGLNSIFNGEDLTGWKVLPDHKSEFKVVDETINVTNGNGALESEQQFGDFVLQLEIYSAGKALNSGIFFRSIPGEFWQGYESQIENGYKDGDRTQPSDFGTGGFYRRKPARRVVANDFEWFYKTLIVSGNHMATWVNGYPVCDWTDTREPKDNPREGFRRAAGTLQIQGHDPTTNLSFRNLKAVELPAKPAE